MDLQTSDVITETKLVAPSLEPECRQAVFFALLENEKTNEQKKNQFK